MRMFLGRPSGLACVLLVICPIVQVVVCAKFDDVLHLSLNLYEPCVAATLFAGLGLTFEQAS